MGKKYFISYTRSDERWATWIAGVLEQHGQEALLQAWDIRAGDNFISKMHEFLQECDVYVPVLSRAYLESAYCIAEWTNAFSMALKQKDKRIIPVRFSNVEPDGLLHGLVYIDLHEIKDEAIAIDKLLDGTVVEKTPRKPGAFPGGSAPTTGAVYPGALPPNNLPERNEYFTGRAEVLSDIQTKFPQNNIICIKQTIVGLGGIGKTQTTLEYAYRNGSDYHDAIWWVNAESDMAASSDLLGFAEIFGLIPEGLDEARKLTPKQLGERLRSWFAEHHSWLLIFDNVEKREVIKPYTNVMQTGHILITTRNRELRQGKSIDISLFTPKESADFMHTRLSDCADLIEDKTVLTELTKRLDYLPLALEQAAAYIDRTQVSCRKYLSLIEKQGLKLLSTRFGEPTDYHGAVPEVITLTMGRLSESAKQLLYLCSYMSPDRIPVDFFERQCEDFPQPLCEDIAEQTNAIEIIAELIKYSLLKRDGDSFLNLHRLVQEIIRDLIKDDDTDWLGVCLDAMIDTMPEPEDYGRREPRIWFEQIAAHTASIVTYTENAYTGDEEKEKQTAMLCFILAQGSSELAQYNKALEWYHKALVINEKALGKEHSDIATMYNDIALVYRRQGDYPKALEWFHKASDIYEKVLGDEHPDTATTYNNIAGVYHGQGDYPKALEWYQKALVINEKVLGKEHPSTATTYYNIAGVYSGQGDYLKALEWNYKALDIREKILGKEHSDTASTYYNIAGVYSGQGDYPKALEWYQKDLAISEKVLGKEHPETATTYNNIAFVYSSQGDYNKALEWCQKALAIREKVLGKGHPDTAKTYNNIAFVYSSQGDYTKALELFCMSYRIFRLKLGDTHQYTVSAKDSMKTAYQNTIHTEEFDVWLKKSSGQ